MGSYAKLAKRALETEMPIMVQVSHLGFFFFFFGCQICLSLASIWIYMVDRSYNCDYKKVFVPPITILHFFMFWWLQYMYIYKCVFFSLIYCALGGAMKLCRRKWMLFFMVKVRFFLFGRYRNWSEERKMLCLWLRFVFPFLNVHVVMLYCICMEKWLVVCFLSPMSNCYITGFWGTLNFDFFFVFPMRVCIRSAK